MERSAEVNEPRVTFNFQRPLAVCSLSVGGSGVAPNDWLGMRAARSVSLTRLSSPNGKTDWHGEVARKY